jgi:energy-coupling factor transport system permease protein
VQLIRAATAGVLDRALDVAAALEVRGYGAARRAPRRPSARRPWSRHDYAFALSAVGIVAVAVTARTTGLVRFQSDPALVAPVGFGGLAVAAGLLVVALAPFLDRRGIER